MLVAKDICNLLIVAVAGMSITRHIKLLNRIPRNISRRLYTMTSEGKTGRVEDTIREKVNWTRFLMTITTELTDHHVFLWKLTALLQPASLSITNDSWKHRHHTAMREQGGGSGETRTFKFHQSINCLRLHFDMFRFFDSSRFKRFRK
jgi:hypothetical protein